MEKNLNLITLFTALTLAVRAHDPITQKSINLDTFETMKAANISPEIINEIKDFENLISTVTVDEIVAKHYMFDGNFRTALKYLRSEEFTQLQRQLLTIPEIIDVLEFLHLTIENATTRHMGATTARVIASLHDYNNNNNDVDDDDDDEADNRIDKMTTNTGTIIYNRMAMASIKGALNKKRVHKIPQFKMVEYDDDAIAVARTFNEEPTLVSIVLLEDSEVATKAHHVIHNKAQKQKQQQQNRNHHCHHRQHYSSLGTFTTFVKDILQYLPHSAYQNMIKDKCLKNAQFAEFYQALRNPKFKPLIDEVMKTPNIIKVIQNLNSHDVDVESLKPIAFEVISWGPNL